MRRNYVPPISKVGETIDLTDKHYLAPGVQGYAVPAGVTGRVFIIDIRADNPGDGAVGRFLDSLAPHCCISNVVSAKLRGMLRRRGWLPMMEQGECGDEFEIWQRPL